MRTPDPMLTALAALLLLAPLAPAGAAASLPPPCSVLDCEPWIVPDPLEALCQAADVALVCPGVGAGASPAADEVPPECQLVDPCDLPWELRRLLCRHLVCTQ